MQNLSSTSPDLTLHIESQRRPGAIRLSYRINSEIETLLAGWRKMGEISLVEDPSIFQATLAREINNLYRGFGPRREPLLPQEIARRLTARGRALYQQLFPAPLRHFLQGLPDEVDSLMIISDEPWIPWELACADDGQFLSHRFAMTRWLSASPPPAKLMSVRRMACLAAGEVAKPVLREPSAECSVLVELAKTKGIACALLDNPTRSEVDNLLTREPIDILHLCGHGESESRRAIQDGFRLAHDARLRALDLFNKSSVAWAARRPLFFVNACHAGSSRFGLAALEGWAAAAIRQAKVGAFVGPSWSVRDRIGSVFSKLFYSALAEGESLGCVARTTRRLLWDGERAPEAFAYAVYGHPHAVMRWEANSRRPQ